MKAATAVAEARAHHFNPQCWLAGFTDTGEKEGRLWVTDLKRQKQWPSNPENTGHRRDFYRISNPASEDPLAFEKLFSRIEDVIAPLFKALDKRPRAPYRNEWEPLFTYIAVQWMRVPAFRPKLLRMTDTIHRRFFAEALKTPDSWAAWLRKVGVSSDDPGADYNKMIEFQSAHHYTLSAENERFLLKGFEAIECIVSCLAKRFWRASISERGGFIGSDNPVAMDGPKGQEVGFETADIVLFPASRHVLVYGANRSVSPLPVTYKRVAAHNTFTMLTADEQVYSHEPDFCWLDENGKCQNDWKLFSKEKLAQSTILGLPIAMCSDR